MKYTSSRESGLDIPTICCDYEGNRICDALVLGSLMQGLAKEFTVWPDPGPPYQNISIQHLTQEVDALEIFTMCTGNSDDYHGIRAEILGPQQEFGDGTDGLVINDFL